MTPVQTPVDLFSLIDASMQGLIDALETEAANEDENAAISSHADQIADLILAEAVRLIRLGTRSETAGAGAKLANALIGPNAPELEKNYEDAFMSMVGASRVLRAASAPSSPGADLTVLRSWNGKALDVVEALVEARDEELPRSEIRALLGEVDESYLSHLLADLEAARLIVRVREGRMVTVHLGVVGRSERVRRMLRSKAPEGIWSGHRGHMVFVQNFSLEDEPAFTPLHSFVDPSRLQEADLSRTWHDYESMSTPEPPEMTWAFADKQTEAQIYGKATPVLANTRLHSSGE
jgi:DNA-binding transcriptional ArsR family regulator